MNLTLTIVARKGGVVLPRPKRSTMTRQLTQQIFFFDQLLQQHDELGGGTSLECVVKYFRKPVRNTVVCPSLLSWKNKSSLFWQPFHNYLVHWCQRHWKWDIAQQRWEFKSNGTCAYNQLLMSPKLKLFKLYNFVFLSMGYVVLASL